MRDFLDDNFELATIAVCLLLIVGVVAWGGCAANRSHEDAMAWDRKAFAGCAAPSLIQIVPHVSVVNGTGSSYETYLYRCQDGRTIETNSKAEEWK